MGGKECRAVKKLLKYPVRFLANAGDRYVRAMTQLSDQIVLHNIGPTMGCPAVEPMSFSGGSLTVSDDYSELVRAASVKGNLGNRIVAVQDPVAGRKMGRRRGLRLGTIEEEKSCHVVDDSV